MALPQYRIVIAEGTIDRFMNKVEKTNGCWLWTGAVKETGYGAFSMDHRMIRSHRAAYVLFKGQIPDGLVVCHSCDNRRCVNPDHLFLGTQGDNLADARAKGRLVHLNAARGEKHPMAKLNRSEVEQIRNEGGSYKQIADRFNVGTSTVFRIKNGLTWKEGGLNA